MKNTAYQIREDILATTTGGHHLTHETPMNDLGEGVDNCPEGVMELMEKAGDNISLEYTSITFNPENIVMSIGAADTVLKSTGATHIYPRNNLKLSDFRDLICLYPMTGGAMCGAILKNVLTSNGLDIQTNKGERGTHSVTLVPHVSIHHQGTVPIEYFFIPAPTLSEITVTSTAATGVGATAGDTDIALSGYTLPTGYSYLYKIEPASEESEEEFDPGIQYGDLVGGAWTVLESASETISGTTSGDYIVVVAVDIEDYVVAAGYTEIEAKAGE